MPRVLNTVFQSIEKHDGFFTFVKVSDSTEEVARFLEEFLSSDHDNFVLGVVQEVAQGGGEPAGALEYILGDTWTALNIAGSGLVWAIGPIKNHLIEEDAIDPAHKDGIAELLETWGMDYEEAKALSDALDLGKVLVVLRMKNQSRLPIWMAMEDVESKQPYEQGILRLGSSGHIPLSDFRSMLSAIENAYNGLVVFESLDELSIYRFADALDHQPLKSTRAKLPLQVPVQRRLFLGRVQLSSPGWLELIGGLNPLEFIRKILSDRHERRKDDLFRNSAEAERLSLQNRILENKLIKERVAIGKSVGLTNAELAPIIHELVTRPLKRLDEHQSSGLITSISVLRSEEEGEAFHA